MSENQASNNRIWRPVVEPTDQIVPTPGSLSNHQSHQQQQQQQVYTKTSLVKTSSGQISNSREANLQNLNREILSVSQAFNNSPKPFYRASSERQVSSRDSPSLSSASGYRTSSRNQDLNQQQQQPRHQQELDFASRHVAAQSVNTNQSSSSNNNNNNNNSSNNNNISAQQTNTQADMANLKLVHKQYNSPIDLYSMNNIRKTIEAHTELIAPGVKGINFMKPDTPVNKQSEVYKLVMEEENQRSLGQSGSSTTLQRLSPISGQPLNVPHTYVEHQQETVAAASSGEAAEVRYASLQNVNQKAFTGVTNNSSTGRIAQQRQDQNDQRQPGGAAGPPTCCECGQFIVGPFARIQNRCVHAHCFNCSTCGTSLKNTGYFTVNEKLYCDIHAKQVANMMHIRYDFGERQQQQQQQQLGFNSASRTSQSEAQKSNIRHSQETHLQPLTATSMSSSSRQVYSTSTSPATISTMFADRSHSQTTASGGDTSWSWRPTTGSEIQESVRTTSGSNMTAKASNYYSQEEGVCSSRQHQLYQQQQHHSPVLTNNGSLLQEQQQQQQQQQQQHHQQQVISMATRGRGLLQENATLSGGRLPVCTHCQVQIHGPYILAGRATWCKHCSQANFNCSSCRRSLLDTGFIQDNSQKYYCEHCFEAYYAPICSKCNIRIKGDCLNALSKQWHPSCFVCGHCRRPFGNSSFYLEDSVPYCERDWSVLFTTKCYNCSYPIQAGDKWIEALERNYHANCFRCSSCKTNLEGSTFYSKNGKPYCRLHAR